MKKILKKVLCMALVMILISSEISAINLNSDSSVGNTNLNTLSELNIKKQGRLSGRGTSAEYTLYTDGTLLLKDGILDEDLTKVIPQELLFVKKLIVGTDNELDNPVKFSSSMISYFSPLRNVESIEFKIIDTSSTTMMTELFKNLSKLKTLELGDHFDTSKVTNMAQMFSMLTSLETLDLKDKFYTQSVTHMQWMFYGTKKLKFLDLGENFNTISVRDMSYMFSGMEFTESLYLGDKFDTMNVRNMKAMFHGMTNLKTLDLKNRFSTANVIDMSDMFMLMSSLVYLDLGDQFDTGLVETMESMFYMSDNITSINLGEFFDTSNVKTTANMFAKTSSLESLDLGDKFNTEKVIYMTNMFYGMTNLVDLKLGSQFNTSNVISMRLMFGSNKSLPRLDLGLLFDTSKVTDMQSMFFGLTSLESLDLGDHFNTKNVTNMRTMFKDMKLVKSLDLKDKFDTSQVGNMLNIFSGMEQVQDIKFGNLFNLSKIDVMNNMFSGNYLMSRLDLSKWILPRNIKHNSFLYDTYLEEIKLGPNVLSIQFSQLPDIVEDENYSGGWYQLEDNDIKFKNSNEFISVYDGKQAQYEGTYVRERKMYEITYSPGLGSGAYPRDGVFHYIGDEYRIRFDLIPELVGHRFTGWKDIRTGYIYSENDNQIMQVYAANVVLEAVFEPVTLNVNFYQNNNIIKKLELDYGSSIQLSDLPLLDNIPNYVFNHWNTKADGSGDVLDIDTFVVIEDTDLFAIYDYEAPEIRYFNVNFYQNDKVIKSVQIENGKSLSKNDIPNLDKIINYVFKHWNRKPDGTGDVIDVEQHIVTEDINLYAIYELEKPEASILKVNFYQGEKLIKYLDIEYGELILSSDIPKLDNVPNYRFDHWNTKPDGTGDVINLDTYVVTDDVNLYAIFSIDQIKITFMSDGRVLKALNVDYDSLIKSKDIPVISKTGYQMIGWNTKNDGSGLFFNPLVDRVKENLVLYATFNIQSFNVIYQDEVGNIINKYELDYQSKFKVDKLPKEDGFTYYWLYNDEKYYGDEILVINTQDIVFTLKRTEDENPSLPDTGINDKSMLLQIVMITVGSVLILQRKRTLKKHI